MEWSVSYRQFKASVQGGLQGKLPAQCEGARGGVGSYHTEPVTCHLQNQLTKTSGTLQEQNNQIVA